MCKKKEERGSEEVSFDWKDYLAIVVAALETSLLPFILLTAVILGISLFVIFFLLG
jgi:hypothetical protein